MRGVPNFQGKIDQIKARIEKKQEELKKLRAALADLEAKADNAALVEITKIMNERNINAQQVIDLLNERFPVAQEAPAPEQPQQNNW